MRADTTYIFTDRFLHIAFRYEDFDTLAFNDQFFVRLAAAGFHRGAYFFTKALRTARDCIRQLIFACFGCQRIPLAFSWFNLPLTSAPTCFGVIQGFATVTTTLWDATTFLGKAFVEIEDVRRTFSENRRDFASAHVNPALHNGGTEWGGSYIC